MFFVLHCGHLTAPSREAAGGFSCSCVVIISVVCATCALLAGCVMLANPGVMGSRVSACLCFFTYRYYVWKSSRQVVLCSVASGCYVKYINRDTRACNTQWL